MKVTVDELQEHLGAEVTLSGWVMHNRPSGKVGFVVVRDGTGLCQCVVEKTRVSDDLFEALKHLGTESSLSITGTVRAEPRSPGGHELVVTDATILCPAVDYPITPKEHGVDFLLRHRHLHLRSQRAWSIGRVRHTVIDVIRRFFNDEGFILVDTPIFTTLAGEGEQTLFAVDYFGQPVHLTQTGQLYLEAAVMSHRKVYCFGPTFRAEKSKTRRHLAEFWMVEPEVAFIDLDGLLNLAERFVTAIVQAVLQHNRSDLQTLEADVPALEKIAPPFPRLTYSQAVDILRGERTARFLAEELADLQRRLAEVETRIAQIDAEDARGGLKKWKQEKNAQELIALRRERIDLAAAIENNPKHAALAAEFTWGKDLGGSDETILSRMHDKPLFVTHYPKAAKAFYMKVDRAEERVVENFDLLAPAGFGEIIGGSMREDDYPRLAGRINELGYNPEHYQWYLDLRRYGSVPHGGFGLGVERTVAWIAGERHIRHCIAFPRMMDRLYL